MNANGVRHVNNLTEGNGSLMNITQKGEFTISTKLICADGTANDRSLIYCAIRVYQRNATIQLTTRGTQLREFMLSSCYYRDDALASNGNVVDGIVVGGTVRLALESDQQFEVLTIRRYSQDPSDASLASNVESFLTIDKHVYSLI